MSRTVCAVTAYSQYADRSSKHPRVMADTVGEEDLSGMLSEPRSRCPAGYLTARAGCYERRNQIRDAPGH